MKERKKNRLFVVVVVVGSWLANNVASDLPNFNL
jgi:hypothetical protein